MISIDRRRILENKLNYYHFQDVVVQPSSLE